MRQSKETNPDNWPCEAHMGIEYGGDVVPQVYFDCIGERIRHAVMARVARFLDNERWETPAFEILDGLHANEAHFVFPSPWPQTCDNAQAITTHYFRMLSLLCMACYECGVRPIVASTIDERECATVRDNALAYSNGVIRANELFAQANGKPIPPNPHYDPHGDLNDPLYNENCAANRCQAIDADGERCQATVRWRRGPQSAILSGECDGMDSDGFETDMGCHKATVSDYPLGLILDLLWEGPPWVAPETN